MSAEITVLISGRGSNMQSVNNACMNGSLHASITQVISNNSNAAGLDYARQHGIKTSVLDHRDYVQRPDYDRALIETIQQQGNPDLILLAGFMRRLTPTFTKHFESRVINIHPSLLPKYPGLDTHARALKAGDRWHGCSVHFVNESLDGGPLIARGIVPVLDEDTEATLADRVLATEHQLLPIVARLFLHEKLACQDSHVQLKDSALRSPILFCM